MVKKLLEDIIQTAKAAGADVKVVQIGSTEKEVDERPAVPLLKLELSIKKDGDALSVLSHGDWNILGSLFLEMAPINIDIEKVKGMFIWEWGCRLSAVGYRPWWAPLNNEGRQFV